jgi:O-antigen/teichoic acid export membrane protein
LTSAGPSPPATDEADHRQARAHEITVALRSAVRLGGSMILTWTLALYVKFRVPDRLGPVLQGQFNFAESFSGMFFTLIGLGVETYISKEVAVRPKHASDFFGGVTLLRLVISALIIGGELVSLNATHRSGEIQAAVVVFGMVSIFYQLNATLAAVLQANSKVGGLATANVAGKIIWAVGLLAGLHFRVPLWGLAAPGLLSEVMKTAVLLPSAYFATDLRFRVDWAQVKAVTIASIPYFISNVTIGFGNNLAMTSLEFMHRDDREVGWFGATQQLAALSMLLSPVMSWIVTPWLARSYGRSPGEMMLVLRRCIEAFIIVISPVTILISAGSSIALRLAINASYEPAAAGLSILSLIFVITYLNTVLATGLVVVGKSWSVTLFSILANVTMLGFMFVFVPIGRALVGEGGECAGAAMAVIANETCVILAFFWRFDWAPLDRRNVVQIVKQVVAAAIVLTGNHVLAHFIPGLTRLAIDMGGYLVLALAIGILRPSEIRRGIAAIRSARAAAKGATQGANVEAQSA